MATKKTIAIIGAQSEIGSALAKSLAHSYRLLLFSSESEKANGLAEKIREGATQADVECSNCLFDASWEADIIIPAVSYAEQRQVAERIRDVATQKVVVSLTNPLNENQDGLVTPPGTSAAQELQELLPASKIVKAFNTNSAADFSMPREKGQQADGFIAGDDEEAVQTVAELVKTAGLNPVIAGKLAVSNTLENMSALMIQMDRRYRYRGMAGWKIVHR